MVCVLLTIIFLFHAFLIDILIFLFYCSRESGKTVMLAIDHGYFEGPRPDWSRWTETPSRSWVMRTLLWDASSTEDEHSSFLHPCSRTPGERRGKHFEGTVQREDRGRYRRCAAPQYTGSCGDGFRRPPVILVGDYEGSPTAAAGTTIQGITHEFNYAPRLPGLAHWMSWSNLGG